MISKIRAVGAWLKRRLIMWIAARLGVANLLFPKGKIHVDHFRQGELIGQYDFPNGIVDVGLNKLLDVMFAGDTAVDPWYIGLVNNSGFSAFANADTMASHAGWSEFTSYDEATRVEWDEDAAASRAITNTTPAEFTISATGVLKGVFVTSENTKSGATGTLWATAAFTSNVSVADNDVLRITYTVSG